MAIRFRCVYDGSDFHGFQRQRDGLTTVQGVLEEALSAILGPGRVLGAGRTDQGVHADGQVIVWRGRDGPIPLERLAAVVSARLPASVRLYDAVRVDDDWDPVRAAVAKAYTYRIWRAPAIPARYLRYAWHLPERLDAGTLRRGAARFAGSHDFKAFRAEGSSARTTVRTVLQSRWRIGERGALWSYEVVGDGFLYHMVRMMVGAMIADARDGGRRVETGLLDPLGSKAGPVAPAHGLTLDWVRYPEMESNGGDRALSEDRQDREALERNRP